ncbi:MAG: fumarylacetoacetate hydrolase family protein, partial [Leptospiraceae bacterium]|nr:fumarylacetoacetate hydrolase family protein [Leptospiraceae bacterium]
MPQYVIRFREKESQRIGWAVKSDAGFLRLPGQFENLGELVLHRSQALQQAKQKADLVPEESIQILSPATPSSQLICQGKNYSEHIREGGENPADKTFNLFFQKASSSISGPEDVIIRPTGVRLLD